MATTTAKNGFNLPTPGGDRNTWGGLLNTNFEDLDDILDPSPTGTSPYLTKAGGTVTGSISREAATQINEFWEITTGAVDQKYWHWLATGTAYQLRAIDDDESWDGAGFRLTRSGDDLTGFRISRADGAPDLINITPSEASINGELIITTDTNTTSMLGSRVTNVDDPTEDDDAATKGYGDTVYGRKGSSNTWTNANVFNINTRMSGIIPTVGASTPLEIDAQEVALVLDSDDMVRSPRIYSDTTASASDAVTVASNGRLRRSTSRAAIKKNISSISANLATVLDTIQRLEPKYFNSNAANDPDDFTYAGFITDQVEVIMPCAVEPGSDHYDLRAIVAYLTVAVQHLLSLTSEDDHG